MKIDLPRPATVGEMNLDAGEYLVSISPESGKMILVGKGGEFKINAARRPAKKPVKRPALSFTPSMGDPFWIISYTLPPKTEWVAFIRLERRNEAD